MQLRLDEGRTDSARDGEPWQVHRLFFFRTTALPREAREIKQLPQLDTIDECRDISQTKSFWRFGIR